MQQLYASIRESSKYHGQNRLNVEAGYGNPFKVKVVDEPGSDFIVKGGVGRQYRLDYVDLFVIEGGQKIRIR